MFIVLDIDDHGDSTEESASQIQELRSLFRQSPSRTAMQSS